jgi:chromosome partitioning protein
VLRQVSESTKLGSDLAFRQIGGSRGAQTLAVVQQKGGVGKTTIAVNLAAELAIAGHRTLLIDVDPLGSASRYLGVADGQLTVADVVTGRAGVAPEAARSGTPADDIEAAVDRIFLDGPQASAARVVDEIPNLFVVPSSRELSKMERSLKQVGWLKEALEEIPSDGVDVVILDTPPRWDMLTISALVAVRRVIAPTELNPLSLMALSRLVEGMATVQRRVNPYLDPQPWIIPSRVRHTRLARQCLVDLEDANPGRVLPMIRESARVAEAPGFHMPVRHFAPKSIGANDFEAVTEATLQRVFRKRLRQMTLSV